MNPRRQQGPPSIGRLRRSRPPEERRGRQWTSRHSGCAGEDPRDRRPPPTSAPGAAGPQPATAAVCGTAGGPDVTGAGAAGTGADETVPGTVTGGAGTVTGGADTVTGGADTVTGGGAARSGVVQHGTGGGNRRPRRPRRDRRRGDGDCRHRRRQRHSRRLARSREVGGEQRSREEAANSDADQRACRTRHADPSFPAAIRHFTEGFPQLRRRETRRFSTDERTASGP